MARAGSVLPEEGLSRRMLIGRFGPEMLPPIRFDLGSQVLDGARTVEVVEPGRLDRRTKDGS